MKIPDFIILSCWLVVLLPGVEVQANVDEKITCLVNVIRKQNKLPPLTMDARLTKAAKVQAEHQAKIKHMTHDGPNKSTVGNRADDAKYVWTTVAENVAYGFEDDETVMYKWWCSPGHKVNLLSPNKNHGSAKVVADNKVPYYAQVFGTEKTDPPSAKAPQCDKYGKEIKKLEELLKKPCDSKASSPSAAPKSGPKSGRQRGGRGRNKKQPPKDDYDTGSETLEPSASEGPKGSPPPPTRGEQDYPTGDEDLGKATNQKKGRGGRRGKGKKVQGPKGGDGEYDVGDDSPPASAPATAPAPASKGGKGKKEKKSKGGDDEYDIGDDSPPAPAPASKGGKGKKEEKSKKKPNNDDEGYDTGDDSPPSPPPTRPTPAPKPTSEAPPTVTPYFRKPGHHVQHPAPQQQPKAMRERSGRRQ